MTPLLPISCARRFYDGRLADVRLNHPEGLAVDERDGALWCGGEWGELYRVAPAGDYCEQRAITGGYALGLARARDGRMFLCDWKRRSIAVFSADGLQLAEWTTAGHRDPLQVPNFPLLSPDERHLYVSDTRADGPGIWRFEVSSGQATWWLRENCRAANGLAFSPDGAAIYLVESKRPGVVRIPLRADGTAGDKEPFIDLPGDEPDGLAFDSAGRLYIAVWHPSRIYRWCPLRGLELLIEDTAQEVLHHPTNLAFRTPRELFVANLGGWHLTRIDLSRLES